MTDREMLELAAKAAGIELFCWDDSRNAYRLKSDRHWNKSRWNPLTDDGDAFRLVVKLGIRVMPYPIFENEKHSVFASRRLWSPTDDGDTTYVGPEVFEVFGSDPYAATRRAVVRAAAEIGKAM